MDILNSKNNHSYYKCFDNYHGPRHLHVLSIFNVFFQYVENDLLTTKSCVFVPYVESFTTAYLQHNDYGVCVSYHPHM
jgi:hypothetical protein